MPGSTETMFCFGMGGGELTLYAHLKKGSIAVKPGQLDDTVYV